MSSKTKKPKYRYECRYQSKMHGDVCNFGMSSDVKPTEVWHTCIDGKYKKVERVDDAQGDHPS